MKKTEEKEEEEESLRRLKGLVLSAILAHNVSQDMFALDVCVRVCASVCDVCSDIDAALF